MLTIIVFRGFFACVVDLPLHMTNKALFLLWQWKGVLLNCLIHVPMTRFLHYTECSDSPFSNMYVKTSISFFQMQGPFDTFLVGGDTAEVCDIKFSNDGKSMLLTTTNNNIYVLDAYGGEKVDHTNSQIFFLIFVINLSRCQCCICDIQTLFVLTFQSFPCAALWVQFGTISNGKYRGNIYTRWPVRGLRYLFTIFSVQNHTQHLVHVQIFLIYSF